MKEHHSLTLHKTISYTTFTKMILPISL